MRGWRRPRFSAAHSEHRSERGLGRLAGALCGAVQVAITTLMRVVAAPPAGPSSASGSVAHTGTRAWGRASGLGVPGAGERWPAGGADPRRSSVTQGCTPGRTSGRSGHVPEAPREGGPAPSLQSPLPLREQSSVVCTADRCPAPLALGPGRLA